MAAVGECCVLMLLLLSVFMVTIASSSVEDFPRFSSGSYLQEVTVDPDNGYVFVAGKNNVYRLNPDLSESLTLSTGPVKDSVQCDPERFNECSGLGVHDNDARVLELDQVSKNLLYCGSVFQGLCLVLDGNDMTVVKNLSLTNRVNFLGSRQSTYAFYSTNNDQQSTSSVMYVAMTYDGRPLSLSQPAISARQLKPTNHGYDMEYLHHDASLNQSSAIFIQNPYRQNYMVKYIYGFEYNGFTYFLTLQRQNVDPTSSYEARLVRVCQNDPGFYSYAELRLSCRKRNGVTTFYNIPQAAYLADFSKDLQRSLGAKTGEKILYVVYSTSKYYNDTADPLTGSGLCTYRMSKIEESFVKSQQSCYQGTGKLLEWVKPDHKCQKDLKIATSIDTSFCGNPLNVGIDSRYSHKPSDSGETETKITTSHLVTSLVITNYNEQTIAIMGTTSGDILKMLVAGRNEPPYAVIPVGHGLSHRAVARDMTLDRTEENLYVLTGSVVTSVPLRSCSVYQDCSECVLTRDPLGCGWCNNRCTRNAECTGQFSPDSCPPVLNHFEPHSGPLSGGTRVTITGRYFGNATATVKVAYQTCVIKFRNITSIVCETTKAPNRTDREVQVDVTDMTQTTEDFTIRGSDSSRHVSFSYREPKVTSFFPELGPKSGGTKLTVYGQYLNIGSHLDVTVAGRPCVVKSTSSEKVVCMTSAWSPRQPQLPGNNTSQRRNRRTVPVPEQSSGTVNITIDAAQVAVNGSTFSYEDDPVIDNIYPRYSIVSGGFVVTVMGKNLHIITNPKIEAVVVNGDGKRFRENCTADPNGDLMTCLTPDVSTTTSPVVPEYALTVDMSLILDGVAPPSVAFKYRIDPIIYTFEESSSLQYLYKNDVFITIWGEYIDYAAREEDVDVYLDATPCNVTTVATTVIVCKPDRPEKLSDQEPWRQVTVHIGHREYTVGQLQYSDRNTELLIATIMAPFLFIGLVITLIVLLLWMKRTKRGPFQKRLPREGNVHYTPGRAEIGPSRDQHMYRYTTENPYWSETPQVPRHCNLLPMAREPIMDDESRRLIEDSRLLIDRDRLLLLEIIGQGHFGCVYRGFLKIGDMKEEIEVAVKTLKSLTENLYTNSLDARKFLEEALRMREFDHPHIVRLIGIALDKEELPLVVLPFMRHGDLLSYIRNEANSPTVKNLIDFGIQIAEGMAYLSNLKFVHRDLAARNCMLDECMNVKVADFGLSRDIYERDYYSSDDRKAKLPVKWMSLESLEKGIYNTKSDVWSYGVVLWELMTRGVCPYPDVDNWDIIKYLKFGRRMPQPAYCPDPLYAIMLNCWDSDPKQRPTFNELVHDVKSIIVTMQQMQQKVGVTATYVNVPTSQGYLYPQQTNSSAMSTLV